MWLHKDEVSLEIVTSINTNIQIYSVNIIIKIYTKVVPGKELPINSCEETKVTFPNLETDPVDGR